MLLISLISSSEIEKTVYAQTAREVALTNHDHWITPFTGKRFDQLLVDQLISDFDEFIVRSKRHSVILLLNCRVPPSVDNMFNNLSGR